MKTHTHRKVYDTVLELYKELLEIYFDELDDLEMLKGKR